MTFHLLTMKESSLAWLCLTDTSQESLPFVFSCLDAVLSSFLAHTSPHRFVFLLLGAGPSGSKY